MKDVDKIERKQRNYHCSICGQEISEEDYESYDGMCWECWDDQLTEETDTSYGSEDDFEPL